MRSLLAFALQFPLWAALQAPLPAGAQNQGGFSNVQPLAEESEDIQRWESMNARESNRAHDQETPGFKRILHFDNQTHIINMLVGQTVNIRLPRGEVAETASISDPNSFEIKSLGKSLDVYEARSLKENVTALLTVKGTSGNLYTFKLLSRVSRIYDKLEDITVQIVDPRLDPRSSQSAGSTAGNPHNSYNPSVRTAPRLWTPAPKGAQSSSIQGTIQGRPQGHGFNSDRFTDPVGIGEAGGAESVVQDVRVRAVDRNSQRGMAPRWVYRTHQWTYIDFGHALRNREIPTPEAYQIRGGVEQPVQQHWGGPHRTRLVIQARGKFVIRAGRMALCLKEETPQPIFARREPPQGRSKDPDLQDIMDLRIHGMRIQRVAEVLRPLEHAQIRPGSISGEVRVFEIGRPQAAAACRQISAEGGECSMERSRIRLERERVYIQPSTGGR